MGLELHALYIGVIRVCLGRGPLMGLEHHVLYIGVISLC